jgi:predicted Zn-dependent protease
LKAEENYKKAIQIKPDDGVYYFCLANVDMMQNRLPEAKENLIKGLKNEPDDFLATKDLVEVLFQMKKYREAIPFFKRMIKLGKGNPELSKIIAEKLDALGKTRRADVFRDLANENPSAKENEVKDE